MRGAVISSEIGLVVNQRTSRLNCNAPVALSQSQSASVRGTDTAFISSVDFYAFVQYNQGLCNVIVSIRYVSFEFCHHWARIRNHSTNVRSTMLNS